MSVYEDEIDLRPYISALLRNWWQIILFGLLVAMAAFGYSRLQPQKFESRASILLTRTRTALTLAQEFPTITEPIDARSRMDALISIINSDALALATQQELISEIPDESRDLQIFKELVSVSSNGDVITITASAENPELAAKIANVWARQAVEAINQAYSSEQPLGEIQTQLVTAQKQYEISQEDLERFIENNQIELLNKRIGETLFLFSRLAEERTFQISFYFQRKQAMEDLEIRAEALKGQLQNGSLSNAAEIGDALAVLKMRATSLISRTNVFVEQDVSSGASQSINIPFLSQTEMDSGFVFSLQIDEFSNLLESPQDYLPDLETIVQMAQMEQIRASEEIERLSQ
ncbi:MAG: hypothetical protein IBX69_16270, partial [Anaerolineales bacterium]|nr:hypothetical protein [Anaerolineales bacterium]